MKTMELETFGVTELNFEERNKIDGGFVIGAWAAFWIGVGIGVASIAVYDFNRVVIYRVHTFKINAGILRKIPNYRKKLLSYLLIMH